MTRPVVLNRKAATEKDLAEAVYIGRPSRWGNPFKVGRDGTRAEVVAKFRKYLFSKPDLMQAAREELAGRNLICFCTPLECHGDVLLEIANAVEVSPNGK
jgi:hypothetical protein